MGGTPKIGNQESTLLQEGLWQCGKEHMVSVVPSPEPPTTLGEPVPGFTIDDGACYPDTSPEARNDRGIRLFQCRNAKGEWFQALVDGPALLPPPPPTAAEIQKIAENARRQKAIDAEATQLVKKALRNKLQFVPPLSLPNFASREIDPGFKFNGGVVRFNCYGGDSIEVEVRPGTRGTVTQSSLTRDFVRQYQEFRDKQPWGQVIF